MRWSLAATLSLSVIAALWLSAAVSSPLTQPAAPEVVVTLPAKKKLSHAELTVAPKAGKAVLVCMLRSEEPPTGPNELMTVVDLKTGKTTDLAALLPKEWSQAPFELAAAPVSPGGDRFLLILRAEKRMAVATLSFGAGEGTAKVLAEGMFANACWAGEQVAVSPLQEDKTLGKVRLVNPADGKSAEVPAHAVVHLYDPAGKRLLVMGDPNNLAKAADLRTFRQTGQMLLIGLDGKVQKVFPQKGLVVSMGSPSGQFVAMSEIAMPFAPDSKPPVTIHDLKKGDSRKVKTPGSVQGVLDDGRLVVSGAGPSEGTATVVDAKGKATEIAKGVQAACVCGDTLYYVVGDEKLTIQSAKIPPAP